jgi:hypothetical protein
MIQFPSASMVEEALAKVERARSWSPRVVSRLEHHIRTAADEDLFRVNPLQWASHRSLDEYEAVDLFLHAAKVGLFYRDGKIDASIALYRNPELIDLSSVEEH